MQKGSMKKVVKSMVTAQKWLWWSDNGKILITFQVNVGADSQLEEATQICLKCCYKIFAIIRPPQPLLGRHL